MGSPPLYTLSSSPGETSSVQWLKRQFKGIAQLYSLIKEIWWSSHFSFKAQILKLSFSDCIGVNFIKQTAQKFLNNSRIYPLSSAKKHRFKQRAQEVIFTSCLAACFSWDTVICFPLCRNPPHSPASFPLLPDSDRKPAHITQIQLLCFTECRK